MKVLGDCMLGTVPPLTLRLLSDLAKPRLVGPDGKTEFTIGAVELLAAGQTIDDPLEKAIAWFLMNNGGWPGAPTPSQVAGGELISIGFDVQPEVRSDADQGFETIGFMSQMLWRQYNEMTAGSGRVDQLIPKRDPGQLGVMIPSGSISGVSI
jgi:hypothetical protein